MSVDGLVRCAWCGTDPEYVRYHDREWGRPVHDGRQLFGKLCLEVMQGGLNWLIVLKRREALRAAFEDFDPARLARWSDDALERARERPGVIRHQGKIRAIRDNARAFEREFEDPTDFARFVWEHAPAARPESDRPRVPSDVRTQTPESGALAADLRRRGFRHIGPVSVYAFMQSMGLVDDHLAGCWRATSDDSNDISRGLATD